MEYFKDVSINIDEKKIAYDKNDNSHYFLISLIFHLCVKHILSTTKQDPNDFKDVSTCNS